MASTAPIRDLLQAIYDALDVPQPAAMEDWELLQGRALGSRAAAIRGVLASTLEHGVDGGELRLAARILRRETAKPLPYGTEAPDA